MSHARALVGYNKASQWQLMQNLKTIPYFLKYLHKADALGSSILQLADYGSSEGFNSMVTFNTVLEQFRNSSNTPIMVFHTDTEENCWETLFKTINHSTESYKRLKNVYFSAIGTSFYNQLFPSNSIHLGYSVTSFHHLSKIPQRTSELGMMIPEVRAQLMEDLTLNLSYRINELAVGGYFVLSLPVTKPENKNYFDKPLYDALLKLLNSGEITKEEYCSYLNQWYFIDYPAVDKVLSTFKDKIDIELNEITDLYSPYFLKYKNDRNLNDFKVSFANFYKVLWKNNLKRSLKRSDEDKEKLIDRANQVLFESISEEDVSVMNMNEIVFRKLKN